VSPAWRAIEIEVGVGAVGERSVDDATRREWLGGAAGVVGLALGGARDALAAAGGKDVRLGGGPGTVRQYLQARLIDDLHLAVRPVLLGAGEPLLAGLNLRTLGYECVEQVAGERATHVFIRKKT